MTHAAVLDLEKASDKFERQKLVDLMPEWLDTNTVNMVRALLGPMQIRAKDEPTEYVSTLTRGVPQGAPSSPTLFNMYNNNLATTSERIYCVRCGEGAVVMVADDVLIQVRTQRSLQKLLYIASSWQKGKGAAW